MIFSVNISLSFNTKFGKLPESKIQSLGHFTKFRNLSLLIDYIISSLFKINFENKKLRRKEIISEIIGCNLKYNYKPKHNVGVLEFVEQNIDIFSCARHCLHSEAEWITLIGRDCRGTVFSLVESFIELKYFHGVATPVLLCHKEPARRIQSPLLGALERKIPLGGYFACSSLVLYGIRDRWLPCTERSYY